MKLNVDDLKEFLEKHFGTIGCTFVFQKQGVFADMQYYDFVRICEVHVIKFSFTIMNDMLQLSSREMFSECDKPLNMVTYHIDDDFLVGIRKECD